MKFEQKPKFQPITITLETEVEAEALWEIVRFASAPHEITQQSVRYAIMISNWFSEKAWLGGKES